MRNKPKPALTAQRKKYPCFRAQKRNFYQADPLAFWYHQKWKEGNALHYLDHIQRVMDYIEENLCWEIDLPQCARVAGYSPYHFLRIFREATGLTPADYIRKRRLTETVKYLVNHNCSISESAFRFGFNSQENFIRVFQSEFHILPSEFKAAQNSLKLCEKISFSTEPFSLQPEFAELEAFDLTVYLSPGQTLQPVAFWNRYNCQKLSKRLSGGPACVDYGVSIWRPEGFQYAIGILTSQAKGCTEGTIPLTIPGGKYAVFETPESTHFNFVNIIHRTWSWILHDYLPSCAFLRRDTPAFETYLEEGRSFRETIWIPISERMDNR